MTIVVDASVTMAWCFETEADAYADAALHALRHGGGLVPAVWTLEVANVLLLAERRRRLSRGDADRFLGILSQLPITVADAPTTADVDGVMTLAREHRLTAYDAAYLALASMTRAPLATRDRALRAAAQRATIVLFAD